MTSRGYAIGWQDSELSTKYVYLRLQEILDTDNDEEKIQKLSLFHSEIARIYFADTGDKIENPNHPTGLDGII